MKMLCAFLVVKLDDVFYAYRYSDDGYMIWSNADTAETVIDALLRAKLERALQYLLFGGGKQC